MAGTWEGSVWESITGLGEGEGFIRERLFLTHPCAWTTTVGPPRGWGPRPCCPSRPPLLSATLFGRPPAPIVSPYRADDLLHLYKSICPLPGRSLTAHTLYNTLGCKPTLYTIRCYLASSCTSLSVSPCCLLIAQDAHAGARAHEHTARTHVSGQWPTLVRF